MQLYWHTTAPNYPPLQTVPENRAYISPDSADAFIRDFVAFAHGKIVSDDRNAPGVEIGRPTDTYRRVRIESAFGRVAVLATDGHLPYPYVILLGAAGRTGGVMTGLGIAAVATAGYAGLLAGPPMIGVTAELVGLRLALVTILFGTLVVAAFAGLVRDKPSGATPSLD
jgi:hypothetical protein